MKTNFSSLEKKSFVTASNLSWDDGSDDNKIRLELNGLLEKAEDDGEQHYIRCPELGGELNGVSFLEKDIKQIEKLPSGRIVIVLRF